MEFITETVIGEKAESYLVLLIPNTGFCFFFFVALALVAVTEQKLGTCVW